VTLPTAGAISLTLVMNELRIANSSRAYPISLGDSDVRALAGKPSGAISLSDLYGKSAASPVQPMTLYPNATHTDYGNITQNGQGIAILLTLEVTGGARPLTYSWTNISSTNGMTRVSGTDGSQLAFERTVNAGTSGTASAQGQCTVTDANGVTASTNLLTGTATWGNA